MATIVKPPSPLPDGFSVFLAGSIELGHAGSWQSWLEEQFSDLDIILFNPRRDTWNQSGSLDSADPQFHEQVEWELSALEKASVIALYFDPDTKSPVTLLELGLFARSGKLIVCCPHGFWRKGNVDIVCARYQIGQVSSLDELAARIFQVAQKDGLSC